MCVHDPNASLLTVIPTGVNHAMPYSQLEIVSSPSSAGSVEFEQSTRSRHRHGLFLLVHIAQWSTFSSPSFDLHSPSVTVLSRLRDLTRIAPTRYTKPSTVLYFFIESWKVNSNMCDDGTCRGIFTTGLEFAGADEP